MESIDETEDDDDDEDEDGDDGESDSFGWSLPRIRILLIDFMTGDSLGSCFCLEDERWEDDGLLSLVIFEWLFEQMRVLI